MPDGWRTRDGVLQRLMLVTLLTGINVDIGNSAPRPGPVHVYEGYSSIGKSVTVSKRLVFHMNKDQSLDDAMLSQNGNVSFAPDATNNTTNSSDPLVNHSVQYSIETNFKSNLDGDLLPPMTIETITNDLNEMQKVATNGFKLPEDYHSTTNSIFTQNILSTRFGINNNKDNVNIDSGKHTPASTFPVEEHTESLSSIEESINKKDKFSEFRLDIQGENNLSSEKNSEDQGDEPHVLVYEEIVEANVGQEEPLNYEITEQIDRATSFGATTPIPTTQNVYDSTELFNIQKESFGDEMSVNEQEIATEYNKPVIDYANESKIQSVKTLDIEQPETVSTEYPSTISIPSQDYEALFEDEIITHTEIPDIFEMIEEVYIPQDIAEKFMEPGNSNIYTVKDIDGNVGDEIGTKFNTDDSDLQTDNYSIEVIPATEDSVLTTQILPNLDSSQNINENFERNELYTTMNNNNTSKQDKITDIDYEINNEGNLRTPETDIQNALLSEISIDGSDNYTTKDYNSDNLDEYNDYYFTLQEGESIEILGTFTTDNPTKSEYHAETDSRPNLDIKQQNIFKNSLNSSISNTIKNESNIDISKLITEIDFSKIDFSNLDLSSIDLGGIDLGNIDLSKIPSNINLESFDMSKLPENLDLGNFDLSSIPKDLNLGNLDLATVDLSNLSSSPSFEILEPTDLSLPKGDILKIDAAKYNQKDTFRDDVRIRNIPSETLPSDYGPSILPPFLPPPDYDYENFEEDRYVYLRESPAFILPHFNYGDRQRAPIRSSNPHPQFVVENFEHDFVEPTYIDARPHTNSPNFIRYHSQPPLPDYFHIPQHSEVPLSNIPDIRHSAFPEPNRSLISIRQQTRLPEVRKRDSNPSAIQSKDTFKNPDFSGTDLSKIAQNFDLSSLGISEIPSNFDLSKIDLSSIPANINLDGLDLSKISSNFDLSSIDLSKIDLGNLDISQILKQFSGPPAVATTTPSSSRQGHAIRDVDYANLYDYTDDVKINVTHLPPMRAENVPGSRQWVTEAEADQNLVEELGILHLVKMAQSLSLDGNGNIDFLMCTMCKTGVVTGKKLMKDLQKSDREIKSLVIYICIQFDLFPKDVCRGMINIVGDEIMHVLRSTEHSPENFCSLMLTNQCEDAPLPPWSTDDIFDPTAPRTEPIIPPSTGDMKILHISDLHLDSEYKAGSDTDCDHPLCCRDWGTRMGKDVASAKNKSSIDLIAAKVMADADDPNMDNKVSLTAPFRFSKTAGRWGSFGRCDLPLETIDNLLQAGAALKPDIVYVTGDLPAHDVWMQTRESVKKSIATTTARIRAAFPDTPVVMTVGNHEIVPINSFPVPSVYGLGYNPTWLYESLAHHWSGWVPQESMDSLKKGGYYVTSPKKGLKVISINGNYCNSLNWWLLLSHKDPTSQLEWLKNQLFEAESSGDAVHILTHIPPGNHDCEQNWSKHFAAIVARYSSTVRGVFSGHQHLDQWQVMYDPREVQRPVSVVYIAPSATTFREHSPSFRVFDVDGGSTNATWSVVDHHTYTTNLTLANLPGNSPEYKERYTARQAFGMADLSPESWAQVVHTMATNQTMFDQHMRFKHNYWSEPSELQSCDKTCKERSLCFLITGDSSNKQPCEDVKRNIIS